MEIYDNVISDYEQLLRKREEMNDILNEISSSYLYSVIGEELNKQYNTIKIEKQDVIGYSIAQRIKPGDKLTLCKKVAVVDSNDYAKDHLIDHAIRCLTSL